MAARVPTVTSSHVKKYSEGEVEHKVWWTYVSWPPKLLAILFTRPLRVLESNGQFAVEVVG